MDIKALLKSAKFQSKCKLLALSMVAGSMIITAYRSGCCFGRQDIIDIICDEVYGYGDVSFDFESRGHKRSVNMYPD